MHIDYGPKPQIQIHVEEDGITVFLLYLAYRTTEFVYPRRLFS